MLHETVSYIAHAKRSKSLARDPIHARPGTSHALWEEVDNRILSFDQLMHGSEEAIHSFRSIFVFVGKPSTNGADHRTADLSHNSLQRSDLLYSIL